MAADRQLPTSASGVVPGDDYLDQVAEEVTALWNGVVLPLTAIGGTANALTATLVPALTAAIPVGMAFSLTPALSNTAAVTISINNAAVINIVSDSGAALPVGVLVAGRTVILVMGPSGLRLMGASALQKINNIQTFTSNGAWNKPANTPDDALVILKGWGAGGAGGAQAGSRTGPGGGGGAYEERTLRAGDLPATLNIIIGQGAAGQPGGFTSISSTGPAVTWLRAFGGGKGGNSGSPNGGGGGGGGGGSLQTGQDGENGVGFSAPPATGGAGGNGGGAGGGNGKTITPNDTPATPGKTPSGPWGGGGGSGGGSNLAGGDAVFGGAGGADGAGGISKYGGSGGTNNVAGQPRGGGGGANNAPGGRGEAIIHVIG